MENHMVQSQGCSCHSSGVHLKKDGFQMTILIYGRVYNPTLDQGRHKKETKINPVYIVGEQIQSLKSRKYPDHS